MNQVLEDAIKEIAVYCAKAENCNNCEIAEAIKCACTDPMLSVCNGKTVSTPCSWKTGQ
jgi:hypothetical protein